MAAFVQDSGLELLQPRLRSALARGARVRVLTGDYLNITQAHALQRLLDWMDEQAATEDDAASGGRFEARVIEVARLQLSSFHPKAWRLSGPGFGVAFVGSSNISRSALQQGIEWNLRVDRRDDEAAYAEVERSSFEALWEQATPLTVEWVAGYAQNARIAGRPLPTGDAEAEPPPAPPEPHEIQEEALAALAATREAGHRRALCVLATGLGKTYLAALDVAALAGKLPAPPRVLFLAHRGELLRQAAETFRRLLPGVRFGWFIGARAELEGDLVLASVQKLCREEHLARLGRGDFDYVVVDEVHHAAAPSYRRILARLAPRFLLGLTATPERADEGDILSLFDDNVPSGRTANSSSSSWTPSTWDGFASPG